MRSYNTKRAYTNSELLADYYGARVRDAGRAGVNLANAASSVAGAGIDAALAPSPATRSIAGGLKDILFHKRVRPLTIPLAIGIGGALVHEVDLPYIRGASEARALGEQNMTRNMPHYYKTAAAVLPNRALSSAMDPLSDVIKKVVMKQEEVDISDAVKKLHGNYGGPTPHAPTGKDLLSTARDAYGDRGITMTPDGKIIRTTDVLDKKKVLGLAGGAAALGLGTEMLAPTADTWAYQVQQKLTPTSARIKAEDEFAKQMLSGGARVTSDQVGGLVNSAINSAAAAGSTAMKAPGQARMFERAVGMDPMLSQASPEELDMLRRSYNSMTRFAPTVATDEFAVKNYLRESMMSANGPDYNTIGNLAKVQMAVTKDPRAKQQK